MVHIVQRHQYSCARLLSHAAARMQLYNETPITDIVEERYCVSEGVVKFKVRLQGLPLHKAIYVDAEDVTEDMLAAWEKVRPRPSLFKQVCCRWNTQNYIIIILLYYIILLFLFCNDLNQYFI